MSHDFYKALEMRRSIYSISKEIGVSKEKIEEIVKHAVKHTPTAFNSQSGRVIIMFENEHDNLWEITREALKKIVPANAFQETSLKIDSFKAGYGTIVYFEDQSVVESLQNAYPLYSANFPIWSIQSNGMLQNNIWTALAVEGVGASLQHYTELIEDEVKNKYNIPKNWKMYAQMPIGKIAAGANEKEYTDIAERVIVVE